MKVYTPKSKPSTPSEPLESTEPSTSMETTNLMDLNESVKASKPTNENIKSPKTTNLEVEKNNVKSSSPVPESSVEEQAPKTPNLKPSLIKLSIVHVDHSVPKFNVYVNQGMSIDRMCLKIKEKCSTITRILYMGPLVSVENCDTVKGVIQEQIDSLNSGRTLMVLAISDTHEDETTEENDGDDDGADGDTVEVDGEIGEMVLKAENGMRSGFLENIWDWVSWKSQTPHDETILDDSDNKVGDAALLVLFGIAEVSGIFGLVSTFQGLLARCMFIIVGARILGFGRVKK